MTTEMQLRLRKLFGARIVGGMTKGLISAPSGMPSDIQIISVVKEKLKIMNKHIKMGKGVKFERIRRITGYLVGTLDCWNNAKKAEEKDRVKHGMGGK